MALVLLVFAASTVVVTWWFSRPATTAFLKQKLLLLRSRRCILALLEQLGRLPVNRPPSPTQVIDYAVACVLFDNWVRVAPWHVRMLVEQGERAEQEFVAWACARLEALAHDAAQLGAFRREVLDLLTRGFQDAGVAPLID